MASSKLPPLIFGASGDKGDLATASSGFAGAGTSHLQVCPKAASNVSVIAHESIHEAQFTKTQGFDTSHHARAGFLVAAQGVPNLAPMVDDAELVKTLYANDPTAMQAHLEEVHLRALLPGAAGMKSCESAPELRLNELADLLGEVANTFNAAQTGTAGPGGRGVIAEFDPACYPKAGEAVERILLCTVLLHEVAELACCIKSARRRSMSPRGSFMCRDTCSMNPNGAGRVLPDWLPTWPMRRCACTRNSNSRPTTRCLQFGMAP